MSWIFVGLILLLLLLTPVILLRRPAETKVQDKFVEAYDLETVPDKDSEEYLALQQYYQYLASAAGEEEDIEL